MTIPSRPAPPPPTTSQNRGVIKNSNNTIKFPPPPVSKIIPINQNAPTNNYGSISLTKFSSSSDNSTKPITRHFPTARTRYAPTTNLNVSSFDLISTSNQNLNNSSAGATVTCGNKRMPPPRPPPPRLNIQDGVNSNGVLKKPGPPQSVNVLSNLFGRRNKPNISKKPITKSTLQSLISTESNTYQGASNTSTYSFSGQMNNASNLFESAFSSSSGSGGNNEVQLITFDSPPSSPTFAQKSNSDCVSVDSFSSDSISSPSQPESGFEDDFTARTTSPPDPWETICNKINNNFSGRKFSLLPPILSMPTIIRPNNTTKCVRPNKGLAPKPTPNLSQQLQSHGTLNNSEFEDPPMPTCPPPPPPYDTYNDKYVTEEESAYGIALYAFDGAENGDLSFRQNEKIYLIGKLNNEWFMGRTKSGCEGMFPSNYINIKVPLKDVESRKSLEIIHGF